MIIFYKNTYHYERKGQGLNAEEGRNERGGILKRATGIPEGDDGSRDRGSHNGAVERPKQFSQPERDRPTRKE